MTETSFVHLPRGVRAAVSSYVPAEFGKVMVGQGFFCMFCPVTTRNAHNRQNPQTQNAQRGRGLGQELA
jgi:hypothetical protein